MTINITIVNPETKNNKQHPHTTTTPPKTKNKNNKRYNTPSCKICNGFFVVSVLFIVVCCVLLVYGVGLFSGVGGLELALHQEVTSVAYVEYEPYAQAVLIKRMQEGNLDNAPIFDDVRTFDGKRFNGVVDIVFGGFPCQDISTAGKGAGIKEGTRSGLFFELMRIVNEIRPTFVFLENVAAINKRGIDTVLGELSKAGYNARWLHLRASDVGARHKRERWFCLGYPKYVGQFTAKNNEGFGEGEVSSSREKETREFERPSCESESVGDLSNTECEGLQGLQSGNGWEVSFGYGSGEGWTIDPADFEPTSESYVGRVAHGIPKRVDRLKCLGNAVVWQEARFAWNILTNNLK